MTVDTVFRFRNIVGSEKYVYEIYVPNVFTRHSKVVFDIFTMDETGQLAFSFDESPSWFSELVEKTKEVFAEKNRIRAIFEKKREPYEVLSDVLSSEEGKEALTRFYYNGYIVTFDEGVYQDSKDALEEEGYLLKTKYDKDSKSYEIHIDEDN